MAAERARKVATLPTPTQADTIYIVDTAVPTQKHIYQTDETNVLKDIGVKTGFMVNKKLLAAA